MNDLLPGCRCVNCVGTPEANRLQRLVDGQKWSLYLDLARVERGLMVAKRPANAQSLSHAAQDAGIVPHRESADCLGCPTFAQVNRDAASVIRWERSMADRWQGLPFFHVTAWQQAGR